MTGLAPLADAATVYAAYDQAPAGVSLSAVALVNLALFGMFVFALVRRSIHLSRGEVATASVTLEVPPKAGHAVLRGVVETEEARPAIAITILEEGVQYDTKQGPTHRWTEISRDVRVEPFYLVLNSGTRVRVEPDPTVLLADTLDLASGGNPRHRRSSLDKGEIAYVAGVLTREADAGSASRDAGLYRGAIPTGFVMRRGLDRMLVSTEPLSRRYQRRAKMHAQVAAIVLAVSLFVDTVFFGKAIALTLFGEYVGAEVTETRTWETHGKSSTTTHYGVRAKYHDPIDARDVVVEDEVNPYVYMRVLQKGARVPFQVVRRAPSICQVGTQVTVNGIFVFLAIGAVLGLVITYGVMWRNSLAWYERKRTEERADGPLPFG